MNDISDLSEFDPDTKPASTGSHSIEDLSEFEPKVEPKKETKKPEWWQGFQNDPSWSGLAARLGIGTVRGAKDIADTAAHGLGNVAATAAEKLLPESISKPIRKNVEETKAADKAARDLYNQEYPSNEGVIPTAADVGRMGGQIAASLPVMPMRAMEGINAAAGALPTVAGRAAPLFNRLVGAAGTGAVGGATLGATTASTNDQSLGENVGTGALSGAVAGPALAGAASAAKGLGNKVIGSISATTADLAKRAEQLGIDLKGSQVSNSPLVKKFDQMSGMLPFSGQQGITDKQVGQFYKAVSNTFGEDTNEITPQVIKDAKQTIGAKMNAIKQSSTNPFDTQLRDAFTDILDKAQYYTPDERGIVEKHIKNVLSGVNAAGELPGETLHNLTKHDAALSAAQNGKNPNIATAANGIRKALENLLARNLPPDELAKWYKAKGQYKAASTVGEWLDQSLGDPNPLGLMRKVNQAPGGKLGGGDLGELAEIARKFFPTSKDSGTPLGEMVLNAMHSVIHSPGTALGAAGTALYHGAVIPDVLTGGAALAANRLARSAVNSKYVKNALINNALGQTQGVTNKVASKVAPYAGLPVINKDKDREPLRLTVTPK